MYYLLAALCSALIAIMIVINGSLTEAYDVFSASVIIHFTGLLFLSVILFIKKENPFKHIKLPFFLYLGGAIGVGTTVFNNAAYGKISVSAILALGLFAQAVFSLFVDHFGLFHMPVRKFNRAKLIGFLCTFIGIILLLVGSTFALVPVLLSLATGITIVASRSVNAELAESSTPLVSTWYNFAVGLICCMVIWLIARAQGISSFHLAPSSTGFFMYTGGIVGVATVLLLNLTVKKMPAFILTLIMFAGQLFTGMILDYFLGLPISASYISGGILTVVGLIVNIYLDVY